MKNMVANQQTSVALKLSHHVHVKNIQQPWNNWLEMSKGRAYLDAAEQMWQWWPSWSPP